MGAPRHRDRLFVAFDLPGALRDELARAGRDLAARCGGRAVPAQNLHATVAFLGDVPAARVPDVAEALAAGDGPPAPVCVGALRARPSASRARLVTVDLDDPYGALAARWAPLAQAVRAAAGLDADPRPPWPHVTVVRLRRPARVDVRTGWYAPEQMFDLSRVTLYRSHLSHEGAPRYEPLAAVPAGAPGPGSGAAP
ncbi:MAG: RNA 2',3'-cyclic phosphodiesterase [Actinomycetota bacterium]